MCQLLCSARRESAPTTVTTSVAEGHGPDTVKARGELRVSTAIEAGRNSKSPLVTVDFADTGLGMTPEIMGHIFDPLYTTKQRGRGTGLGLVIVSQIISEHGATMAVESEPGHGTRFRLIFSAIQSEISV